jgi:hypothetical protein
MNDNEEDFKYEKIVCVNETSWDRYTVDRVVSTMVSFMFDTNHMNKETAIRFRFDTVPVRPPFAIGIRLRWGRKEKHVDTNQPCT